MYISPDYLLNSVDFNLIYFNPLYQLENINPIEADYYTELSSINYPVDTFINPVLTSQYNILNFNNSIGYMQKAYQTLNNISPFVTQLVTLSQNIPENPEDKEVVLNTMNDIYKQIQYQIDNTTYNGVKVFNQEIQIGDSTIKLELPKIDISNPESIENFAEKVELLKKDIKDYLETSSLYSDNFVNSLLSEIYQTPQTQFDFLNEVNQTNLQITADLLATAHNQEYLSPLVEQLLL